MATLPASITLLALETCNGDSAGNVNGNTIFARYRITNTGNTSISLSDLSLRYYYTIDGQKPQNFWCDWAGLKNGNSMLHITDKVTGTFASMTEKHTQADTYVETGFAKGASTLGPKETVKVHIRIAKTDWSNYNFANDYSRNSSLTGYMKLHFDELFSSNNKYIELINKISFKKGNTLFLDAVFPSDQ